MAVVGERSYDAVVVGSGCAGAWAAKELTEAGFHTLVLEAGPPRTPGEVPERFPRRSPPGTSRGVADGDAHIGRRGAFTPYLDGAVPGLDPVPEPVRANQHVQSRHPGLVSRGPHLFVDDVDHPYQTPDDLPYHWIRGMQVGGRSLTWGGTSLRLSAYEFDAPVVDRRALSWPIRYDDLAASYAVVEELMGLCGSTENLPRLPDSVYRHSPRSLTPAEAEFQRAYRSGETRAIPVRFIPAEGGRDGWPGFTMQGTALAAAERTRRMVLRPNAVVTGVTVDAGTGRATGVRFIDKTQGTMHEARARVVFLCCGAIETARLLLVSRGPRHPDGLGNSSGWVGRGLMDHPVVAASGVLDERAPVDGYGVSARQRGLLIPAVSGDGVRPFGVWITLQRRVSNGRPCGNIEAQGEMLPYWHNRVCLGDAKDRWGVPIPRIECAYGPHEERLYGAMRQAVEHLAAVARLRIVDVSTALTVPGLNVHDLGTARMGSDPGTSVLDADNRLWDCPNLFVTDGACFPAGGWQNPTLTIMAISARAARRAAALLREGTY